VCEKLAYDRQKTEGFTAFSDVSGQPNHPQNREHCRVPADLHWVNGILVSVRCRAHGNHYAIGLVYQISQKTDSMAVLQAIKDHGTILGSASASFSVIPLDLQWLPRHYDDLGNGRAHYLAKVVVGLTKCTHS
jgi:hypothetical protein